MLLTVRLSPVLLGLGKDEGRGPPNLKVSLTIQVMQFKDLGI